jgi:phage host-nuclease inhibitor protein Gam
MPTKTRRTRVESTVTISSWQEADDALRKIGLAQAVINKVEAEMNAAANKLRQDAEKKIAKEKALVADHEKGLEAFCRAVRAEFGDKQSRQLNFGEVNFRVHPDKILQQRGTKTEQTIRIIMSMGKKFIEQFIRIKEELNKEALVKESSDFLAQLGLEKKKDESFGYAINWEFLSQSHIS